MADLGVGSTFADHVICGVAGRGGMGIVYRATHVRLKREAALKVIAPDVSGDAAFRARFEVEIEAAAAIDHPNVIPVCHAGEEDGRLFVTMRYVEGIDLRRLLADQQRLDPARAARLIAQVADALDAAHALGVIHRDVKPANILLDGDHALLTDFGLTKLLRSDRKVTMTGSVMGTFDYVAPEQLEGGVVDARTDVYGLGCVLYEALTGEVPYPVKGVAAKMLAHHSTSPPSVTARVPDAPPALDAVIARALAKDPADRFPTAGDLARAALAAAAALPHESSQRPASRPSNLPPRNPYFVGRDEVIEEVAAAFTRTRRVALTGMPGVGKTQVALEYAERHRQRYAARLWLRADSRDALYSDAAAIARVLRLTDHVERSQEHIVELVREWLSEHDDWLVVLDNADDLEVANGLLAADGPGHFLVTTRAPGGDEIAHHVTLEPLDPERSADLLLRRSGAAAGELSAAERAATTEVCERLGGLALAIEQAGAFIARTRATVAEYLGALESETAAALMEGSGSVGATLGLAVRRLREQDAAAADLLALCAFYAPETIPEEIFDSGLVCADEPLGIALARPLDRLRVLRGALRYSLLQRDPHARTLGVHRLVQTVLLAEMPAAERSKWAERAGRALAAAFPIPDYENWSLCERLMPH